MSDIITYADLFNFSDNSELQKATRAINALEKAYTKFSGNLAGEAIRVGQSQAPLLDSLNQLVVQLGKVNTANEEGRKRAAKLAQDTDTQTRAYNGLKQAQKGIEASNKAVEGSLESLRQKLRADREELTKLGAAANPERLRELSASIVDTKTKAEVLERAVRGVNTVLTAAKGSYNALTAENRALSVELKNLANTQDRSGQRTKESIAREQALKIQLATNTSQLKAYDSQLNQHFRNVGNYAGSIVEAINALKSERAALLATEAALVKASGATNVAAATQDKYQRELTETRTKLAENGAALNGVGVSVKSTESIFAGAGAAAKSFAVTMAISTFGLTALAAAAGKAFQNNLKYSDSIAAVRKTTGQTQAETEKFADALEELGTRTSLEELLKIGAIGGQLGIAKRELEGFTKSIDVAAVALSDDFAGGAEQVATELGKIDAIFKLSKEVGVAQSITDIGSALNELGASGAATAPFISDYALRVGAVGKNAGLTVDKIFGLGAALEELGFTAEVAGTATNRLLSGLTGNSSKFFAIAKLADANLTLKEFKSLVNNDVSAALQLFLKGLNNGGAATTDFAQLVQSLGLKSGGAVSVLTTLAKNTELVAEKQGIANNSLREGTSLAKEAAIKNDTLAGSFDKLLNSLTNATTGNSIFARSLKVLFNATAELINGNVILGINLKKAKDNFDDYGAGVVIAAKANRDAANSNESLLARFEMLNAVKGRSMEQDKLLRKTIIDLKTALGENAATLNKETGLWELNTGAVSKAIAARRTEAVEGIKSLAKRINALGAEAESQKALTSAIREEAANRLSILQQSGIKQDELAAQSAIRAKQRSGAAKFSVNEFRDADKVPDALLDQFEAINALNAKSATSNKKAADAERARTEAIKNLVLGGFSLEYAQSLLIQSADDLKVATLEDEQAMKDAAKAAKEYAKAMAELAQSEYELARFRAEQRGKNFERQADNGANPEEVRMAAAQKAAAEQKTIALLEQKEKLRQAKEAAKELTNGDAVLAIKRQLISEQYAARIGEIERDLTKEQLEIHTDAVEALEAIDAFRLESENANLQRLIEDETAGFDIRTAAQKRFAANTILLANLAYNEEIRNAQGNVEKIKLALDKLNESTANAQRTDKPFDATLANDELDIAQKNALIKLEIDRAAKANGIVDEEAYQAKKRELENEYLADHFTNLNVEKDGTKAALDEELAYRKKINDEELEEEKKKQEKKQAILEEAAQLLINIGNAANEVYSAQLDQQLAALSKQKENDLAIAGDNAEAKQRIEANFDREQAKVKRKQAVAAKAAALFEIALNTGIAVAKAVAAAPVTFGLPFSAFALANGAIQAALVLAKPIPAFAKGTQSSPYGPALVGEAGPELLEYNGTRKLVSKPTVVHLKGGTKVYTAKETIKYFEGNAMARQLATGYHEGEQAVASAQRAASPAELARMMGREIGTKFESLEDAVRSQPGFSVSMDKNGVHGYVTTANSQTEILNARYHRGRKQ